MFMREKLHGAAMIAALLTAAVDCAVAEGPNLGQPLTAAETARWSLNVFPDGRGLPPGSGTAAQGEPLFATHCAACHGASGQGGTAEELVGGIGTLATADAAKTVGSYWPYATTLFDLIRRAKPMTAPGSLRPDEVYALTAYVLHLNGLVTKDTPIDAKSLSAIRMPNRDGFDRIDAR